MNGQHWNHQLFCFIMPFHIQFYHIDVSVLLGNIPWVKLIWNYIWDPSGILSISSQVRTPMTSFPAITRFKMRASTCLYNNNQKKITRRLEDMNLFSSGENKIQMNSYLRATLYYPLCMKCEWGECLPKTTQNITVKVITLLDWLFVPWWHWTGSPVQFHLYLWRTSGQGMSLWCPVWSSAHMGNLSEGENNYFLLFENDISTML